MQCPFPGMDPYLELPAGWRDFHSRFINDLSDAIFAKAPESYAAIIEENHIVLEPFTPERQNFIPDVSVARDPEKPRRGGVALEAPPVATPLLFENADDFLPVTEPFIQIVRFPEREVVTVLELFSPANKYGEGRAKYFEKREALTRAKINIVEIDLLRAGKRIPLNRPLPDADYFAFVSPGNQQPKCYVYPWILRQPMPSIPIPLRDPDPSITIDLQAVFRITYERAKYWRTIKYSNSPPAPPLEPADAEWAAGLVRKASA